MLRKLAALKRNPILTDSRYEVKALLRDVLLAVHKTKERQLVGVFSIRGGASLIRVDAPDGVYPDLIFGGGAEVCGGMVSCGGLPVIFETPLP